MDQKEIKLIARLGAIEYMIGQLSRMVYLSVGATPEIVEKSHEKLREYLRTMPMPPTDPAISDLVAAEIQEAHERLLGIIEEAVRGTTQ
jgi:hypothetical protein